MHHICQNLPDMLSFRRSFPILGAAAILLWLAGAALQLWGGQRMAAGYAWLMQAKARKNMADADARLRKVMKQFVEAPLGNFQMHKQSLIANARTEGVMLFLHDEHEMKFWTGNGVRPLQANFGSGPELHRLSNGYYLQVGEKRGDITYTALVPISMQYPLNNKYLTGDDAPLPSSIFTIVSERDARSKKGFALHAQFKNEKVIVGWARLNSLPKAYYLPALLQLAGLLLLTVVITLLLRQFLRRGRRLAAIALYAASMAVLLALWLTHTFPDAIFNSRFFSAEIFATSHLLRSLGDLLILSLVFLTAIIFCGSLLRHRGSTANAWRMAMEIVVSALCLSVAIFIPALVRALVLDSAFSLRLDNIYSLSVYSFVGVGISGLWFYMLFQSFYYLARTQWRQGYPPARWVMVGGIALILALLPTAPPAAHILVGLAMVACCAVPYLLRGRRRFRHISSYLAFNILLSSLTATALLLYYSAINDRQNSQMIATSLLKDRDAVAEYLLSDLDRKILSDRVMLDMIATEEPGLNAKLTRRLQKLYFTGYLNKYEIVAFHQHLPPNYDPETSQSILLDNPIFQGNDYEIIRPYRLYFVGQHDGLPAYFSNTLVSQDGSIVALSILIREKPFYEASLYPELLMSAQMQKVPLTESVNYAVYSRGILVNQKGTYPYRALYRPPFRLDSSRGQISYVEGGYRHLIVRQTRQTTVLVSSPLPDVSHYVSDFTTLLFIYSIAGMLIYGLDQLFRGRLRRRTRWRNITFRTKILLVVLLGLSISLATIGIVTIQFIRYQYTKEQKERLLARAGQVKTRMESLINLAQSSPALEEEELLPSLNNVADDYLTDINIYDVYGHLMASTQQSIFDRYLIGRLMNGEAYSQFASNYVTQVLEEENIGNLRYLSAYLPLRNDDNKIIAFLNLPYFSKEQNLKERISSFVVSIINLYVGLFFILVILGIFLTRALVHPLTALRQHLHNTTLEGNNSIIEWQTNDEIGRLVQEYNRMVQQLQISAGKLARSEREGAWKGMARQVAHEIKNPLTPMKLHLQRLQRAQSENDPRLQEMLTRTAQTLIAQIDTLSEIAGAFGEFASMPKGNPQPVSVHNALHEVAYLYREQNNVQITLHEPVPPDIRVIMDPHQLSRVLGNVVKNALQAAHAERPLHIELFAEQRNERVHIYIKDNGIGIEPELQHRIFTPNFSTKNSGMGLGLAMVKSMLEMTGGFISFETLPGEGTTFEISLPAFPPAA